MNTFVYYQPDGTIVRILRANLAEHLWSGLPHLTLPADADVSPWRHRVVDGELAEVDASVAERRQSPPAHRAHWDWGKLDWVDDRTVEELRHFAWTAVKASRDAAEFGPFTWDGSTFDADAKSQQRIQAAAVAAMAAQAEGKPFSVVWTLADNSVRTLGPDDMIALGLALTEHVARCHEAGRALRATIAAADIETVKTTVWADEYHRAIRKTDS